MAARYLIAFALASAVTFALLWVMQALISASFQLLEGRPPLVVDFVRLKRDTEPEKKKRERPEREKPEQPPPPPELNLAKHLSPDDAVGGIVPVVDAKIELAGAANLGLGGTDREVVPLVRVEPQYPMRAAQRGIEGWVELEFTITTAGTVKDPFVLASAPGTIFDRAALQAVRKWKYNPKIDKGVAVERPGVKVRLVFELSKR